jgi:MFS family permease
LQAFGIYAVGFLSRPVGAAIFGHYGDRIGRKATLITTFLLTGLSTFAVGFVPGYVAIGIWGAVILTLLRLRKSRPLISTSPSSVNWRRRILRSAMPSNRVRWR